MSIKSAQRDTSRDRFNDTTGARKVAGVICLSNSRSHPDELDKKYVLCITSSRHANKLVIPKGGWEHHESVEEAAIRECWEEAGVKVSVERWLSDSMDLRPPSKKNRAEYSFFQVSPISLSEVWPESDRRRRVWLTFEEAVIALGDRGEMLEALRASEIAVLK